MFGLSAHTKLKRDRIGVRLASLLLWFWKLKLVCSGAAILSADMGSDKGVKNLVWNEGECRRKGGGSRS